jgi:CBS domain containing-hemolysin-like protein
MSSDPSERRRLPDWVASGTVGIALFAIAAIPALAIAQNPAAANNTSFFQAVDQPLVLALLGLGMIVVIALNAICVAGAFGLEVLKSTHVRTQEEGTAPYRLLESLVNNKDSVAAACVLASQILRAALVLLCFIPGPSIAHILRWINETSPLNDIYWASAAGAATLAFLIVGVNAIIAELVARSIAVTHPIDTMLRLGWVLKTLNALFSIPAIISLSIANLISRRFNANARFTIDNRVEDEIKEILETTDESGGGIEDEERELLESVFEFGDTIAREIMTPRVDMESIPYDTSLDSVAALVEETGHSRFPIYRGTDDNIIGIVHAKDVLRSLARNQSNLTVEQIMRPAMEIHEGQKLHSLLALMRTKKTQMVILKDELGGTSGLVTIEDIVEELVGEIVDEYDEVEPEVKALGQGHSVSGKLHLDDVNEAIGAEFESEEFDTIGGYVFGLFGRQPAKGETIVDETYVFLVEDSDGRRILRVRIEPLEVEETSLSR